ncbi:MAG: alpha/beta hydrolase [Elusimicrobia bacterium]|nr:alpha/beta hydrolase [Elusimicrobiota bacterium]
MARSLVVLLHGLGASSRSFGPLIEELQDLRNRFDFVAPDFWGFGGTALPGSIGRASIRAFAKQTLEIIAERDPARTRRVHLIGHSMGGAVAIEIRRLAPSLGITSFANLEGNLQPEDCTYSRKVREQGRERFRASGFEALKRDIRKLAEEGSPPSRNWMEDLERTTADVFYDAAADLVKVSSGLYIDYRDWRDRSVYVFGEETLRVSTGTYNRLLGDRRQVAVIPKAGHVMMIDRPRATADVCRTLLES